MRAQKFPTLATSLVAADAATKANRITVLQTDERFKDMIGNADEVSSDLVTFYGTFKTFIMAAATRLKAVFKKRVPGLPAGDYEQPPIQFSKYLVTKMPWANLSPLAGIAGCGNLILAQLTGASPFEIRKFLKPLLEEFTDRPENAHLDKKAMKGGSYIPSEILCAFLNLHGIQTIPVTVRDLCPRARLIESPITKDHVLLTSMYVSKGESTWCIYYQGHCYHNTDLNLNADCYDVFNNPVQEMFILYNPIWKLDAICAEDLLTSDGYVSDDLA